MTVPNGPEELYRRGAATLVAAWEADARGSREASVRRAAGVASAVFPHEPERAVFNNALLDRYLPRAARLNAIDAMERAYAEAGVGRFAAWVHESDAPMRAELEARGYTLHEATRAMGMALDEIRVPRPELEQLSRDWRAHLEYLWADDVPHGLLSGVAPGVYHAVSAGQLATGIAFELDGDCGVYNVGTVARARRRGLGTAVTALLVHEAAERGCRTASLQATAIAERVYAAVGFRDLGLILEYVPGTGT